MATELEERPEISEDGKFFRDPTYGWVMLQPGVLSPGRTLRWDGGRWVAQTVSPLAAASPGYELPVGGARAEAPTRRYELPAPPTSMPAQPVTLSAATAFKIGFFGAIGAWVASAVFFVLAWLALGAMVATLLGAAKSR